MPGTLEAKMPVFIMLSACAVLPLHALYLLLRDLVQFYFVPQHVGDVPGDFLPRFSLAALAFSPDDGYRKSMDDDAALPTESELKTAILRYRHDPDVIAFVMPTIGVERLDYEELYDAHGRELLGHEKYEALHAATSDARLLAVAFALAGAQDRKLVQEVARAEASLVRHALKLRRLVLRYAKALLLLIATLLWTEIVELVVHARDTTHALPALLGLFIAWGVLAIVVVQRPIRWIRELSVRAQDINYNDPAVARFERGVFFIARAVIATAVIYGWMAGIFFPSTIIMPAERVASLLNLAWTLVIVFALLSGVHRRRKKRTVATEAPPTA
jgi:hypothetical protein